MAASGSVRAVADILPAPARRAGPAGRRVSPGPPRCLGCLVLLLSLGGCSTEPVRTPAVTECGPLRVFYVVSHGWHTGIVVERSALVKALAPLADDFPGGVHLEIGWGDEQFYQAPEATPGLALRAVLWPTRTVLHVVAFTDSPRNYFSGSELVEVSVPAAGYRQLLAFLGESFSRGPRGELARIGPGLYGLSGFYRAEGEFHAFNTCNTWVASAVEATGFPLSSSGIVTAGALVSQLRAAAGTTPCFTAR